MASLSFKRLMSIPGFNFDRRHLMCNLSDAHRLCDTMRRNLEPGETNLTRLRAGRLAQELLEACHKHRHKMWPAGRTCEVFWHAVMRDVKWTRTLILETVEEFALALAEGARRAMTPAQYAQIKRAVDLGSPRVVIDTHYPEVTLAAIQFLIDIKIAKNHLDMKGDERVVAYRGRIPPQGRYGRWSAWLRLHPTHAL